MKEYPKTDEEQYCEQLTAERFGQLMAAAISEVRSSAAGFIVEKALEKDGVDMVMADWSTVDAMCRRIAGEGGVEIKDF